MSSNTSSIASSSSSSSSQNPNCQNPNAYLSSLIVDDYDLNFNQNKFNYKIDTNNQTIKVSYITNDACAEVKEFRSEFGGRKYLIIVVMASDQQSSLVYSIGL